MSPRTQRTLLRLLMLFLALGGGDAFVQYLVLNSYDARHLAGALVAALIAALEKWYAESSDSTASPTVRAVNTALENDASSVPPPKVAVPKAVALGTARNASSEARATGP